jgi:hypothetical protein
MMARERIEISWASHRFSAELRRTRRRVLRVEVRSSGDIIVFAPEDAHLGEICSRVKRKCPWIFRQLDTIRSQPAVTPPRHFVSGETHLVLGKPYRLSIQRADHPEVRVEGNHLRIFSPSENDPSEYQRLLTAYYVDVAKAVFRERLDAVIQPFIRKGMVVPSLSIRTMSKRWGSYTSGGRIVLNIDLVRATPSMIDYVICHELAHAFHPDHGKEWRNLMSTVMPDWESRKSQLEALLR